MGTHTQSANGRRRGRGDRAAIRAAVTLAILSTAATAQGDPLVRPSAAVAVEGSYDSNVFNGRGPDYVTRITPRLALRANDSRFDLKLSYDAGIWLYALGEDHKPPVDNSVNHQGRLAFMGRVSRRLTLKVADEVIYAKDPGFLIRAAVIAPQTSIFSNTLDAELDYFLTRRIEANVQYSYIHTTFGAPPPYAGPLFNGDEHDGTLALAFRLGRLDDLRLSNRVAYFNANEQDQSGLLDLALTESPALGWRHRLLRWLEWRVEGGPVFYTPLSGATTLEGEAPAGTVATTSGWTGRGSALLRAVSRDVRGTIGWTHDLVGGTGAATVFWADYLTARLDWRVVRGVDLSAGLSLFANGAAPRASWAYDGISTDEALSVELTHNLKLGGFYTYRVQENRNDVAANAALPTFTRHIVGLRLVAVFGEEAGAARHQNALHD